MLRIPSGLTILTLCAALSAQDAQAQDAPAQAASAQAAGDASSMAPYTVRLDGTAVEIPMVPIPVGTDGYPETFRMGSPEGEAGREADEGPTVQVRVAPFWMGKFEITWDTFDEFRRDYDRLSGASVDRSGEPSDQWADAVSLPTPLYEMEAAPILEGMGTAGGYPVANISQLAARQFAKWLSKKTGHFYRLPTEAEWEYAARAGTDTPWAFGSDASQLAEYAWFFDNSLYDDPDKGHPDFGAGYRKVGTRKANPWGLHDLYGNVSEWVVDQYVADRYAALGDGVVPWREAVVFPETVFPCVVRGGSWESEAVDCRSAARLASTPMWQDRDPQLPKSVWWYTDAFHVGFRLVRPLEVPSAEERRRFSEPRDELTLDILGGGGRQIRAVVVEGEAEAGGKGSK